MRKISEVRVLQGYRLNWPLMTEHEGSWIFPT